MPTKRIADMSATEFDAFVAQQTKKIATMEKKAGEVRRLLKQISRKAGDEKLEHHLDTQTRKLFNIEAMSGDLHRTVGTTLKWYRQVQTGTMPSAGTPTPSKPSAPAPPPLKGLARYNAERQAKVAARKTKAGGGAQAR